MENHNLTHLALIGGFLGAGKTTLLLAAARMLRARGLRVAILTNDQGGDLVDTRLAVAGGFETSEIAGGCFCCRFADFIQSAERLLAYRPDVILAEPVGSCMDISATMLQPLKRSHGERFRLAPFTVLVDPDRAREMLALEAHSELSYLFRNQLAEADLVYFSKADRYATFPELPGGVAGKLSGRTGEGVAGWLDLLLSGAMPSGSRLLDIDYGRYGEAEAALGWLNWHAKLITREAFTPASVVGPMLDVIDRKLMDAGAAVMHLKIMDETPAGYIRASICRGGDDPLVDGALDASATSHHELVVNLRALGEPDLLASIVAQAAAELPGTVEVLRCQSFRPSPPVRPVEYTGFGDPS
jgi:hypothetical protein